MRACCVRLFATSDVVTDDVVTRAVAGDFAVTSDLKIASKASKKHCKSKKS